MPYDRDKHHRRSIRVKGYDYSQPGAYFVTICVQGRACLFGEVREDSMVLNAAGLMVHEVWQALPERFASISLDAFVVMPNHVHLILQNAAEAGEPDSARATLSDIMGAFKSLTTNRYIAGVKARGWPGFDGRLWQRNYYERIIRNENELSRARLYVDGNPAAWLTDEDHPDRLTDQKT